jgi:hypothetical protein
MVKLRRVDLGDLPPIQTAASATGRYVYVMQEAKHEWKFKLGIAGHPLRRLSGLRGGNFRPLRIVAAYRGSDADCAFVERVALKFFKAPAGTEWVDAKLSDITEFLDAFMGED